ncbi:MAG: DNA-processing protein DprA [Spirosomaceae bacterium]|jgi:DNA processing protein|nr:DNA-processing protein DprA [Spirosomataceae bacterium]
MSETFYQLALHLTPNLGSVLIRQLISHFGTAERVFAANLKTLTRVTGIGEVIAKNILSQKGLKEAENELIATKKAGVKLYFYTDANYPQRLKSLYDAPVLMYAKGTIDFNQGRFINIVGTRKATEYGRSITNEIVEQLANRGVTVVSGLAYGIDITAHRACLKHHVPTIGVMATGVDVIYPQAHHKTAEEMQANGGIVTEYRLGTGPDFMRFPARNRIIAGLSDATIVVEAADKGGALITAEYANNYNRDVFAVPGNLTNSYSAGCNKLIREHKAQIFMGIEDLLETLQWLPEHGNSQGQVIAMPAHFTQEESQIVSLIRQRGDVHIDDLVWESQIHPSRLSTLLLNLELQGYLRTLPGKRYALG